MKRDKWSLSGHIALIVRQCLQEGKRVEIDGLGVFRLDDRGGFEFLACSQPRIFLAYVQEDTLLVDRLFRALRAEGFDPWLDRRKLLPGQNWPRAIEEAIETSEFFVACFSQRSVDKKGSFQAEIRYALDCARRLPLDETFLIPLRLDACRVPARIQREIHYIDLFPDWDRGFKRVLSVIHSRRRTGLRPVSRQS